ncbi:thiopeptide-type bacteriocin biosynthesis protein [Streptomyces sp. NPDC089922]|uniref:thiopeptide-type bacteriocin biosynthesis protein n=1 Tax=unclassified Streptomyces TaxID=2593676 RepID=UPI003435F592
MTTTDPTTHPTDLADPADPTDLADDAGTPTVSGGRTWTAWHLHLPSSARSAHDRVLHDTIAPALAEHPGRPWFFVRYWQAGPHLRLRIADLAPHEARATEQRLRETLPAAAALRDGEEPLGDAAFAREAQRLARAGEAGSALPPGTPPLPPGVHRAPYRPERERYGGEALMARSEALFTLSSDLVLAFLSSRPRGRRARALFALSAAAGAAAALGDDTEAEAFRAHGLASWRTWLTGYGHPAADVDRWTAAARRDPADDGPTRALLAAAAAGSGPLAPWHGELTAAADAWRRTPGVQPGRLLFSHLHMLHNRLGLGIADELLTYARLTPPPAGPDLHRSTP